MILRYIIKQVIDWIYCALAQVIEHFLININLIKKKQEYSHDTNKFSQLI